MQTGEQDNFYSIYAPNHDMPMSRLQLLVAHEFCVPPVQLTAKSRGLKRVTKARHVAIYLAHVALGLSLNALARHFSRDRTTIAYACRTVEDARDDKAFDARLARLEKQLNTLIPSLPRVMH